MNTFEWGLVVACALLNAFIGYQAFAMLSLQERCQQLAGERAYWKSMASEADFWRDAAKPSRRTDQSLN